MSRAASLRAELALPEGVELSPELAQAIHERMVPREVAEQAHARVIELENDLAEEQEKHAATIAAHHEDAVDRTIAFSVDSRRMLPNQARMFRRTLRTQRDIDVFLADVRAMPELELFAEAPDVAPSREWLQAQAKAAHGTPHVSTSDPETARMMEAAGVTPEEFEAARLQAEKESW